MNILVYAMRVLTFYIVFVSIKRIIKSELGLEHNDAKMHLLVAQMTRMYTVARAMRTRGAHEYELEKAWVEFRGNLEIKFIWHAPRCTKCQKKIFKRAYKLRSLAWQLAQ